MILRAIPAAAMLLVFSTTAPAAIAPTRMSIEKQTLLIAKHLKPVSDDDWKNIAGTRAAEQYSIVKGDTLYGISKHLFGDPKYWPKIWALNNKDITNPHLIRPGNMIAFMPGSGSALPAVTITDAAGGPPVTPPKPVLPAERSTEWKNLPHQSWENVNLELPPEVDQQGFDKRSKVRFKTFSGYDLKAIAASEKLPSLGEITGARSAGTYLGMGDTVFIDADEALQIGETYAITDKPHLLKSPKSDRMGYSYFVLGTVKVIAVRDNIFIGTLVNARGFIPRGAFLIPVPAKIQPVQPIPASNAIEGIMLLNKEFSSYLAVQYKDVFFDRGSEDGVQPGMVFRAYQHRDPMNDDKITDSDYIIAADMIVVQASERFSSGIVIRAYTPIEEHTKVVLLTDISELNRAAGFRDKSPEEKIRDAELDDLDKLDQGGGLGQDEQRELKQLEQWKKNPPGPLQDTPGSEPPPPPAPDAVSPELMPPSPTQEQVVEIPTTPETAPAPPETAPAPAPEQPSVTEPAPPEAEDAPAPPEATPPEPQPEDDSLPVPPPPPPSAQ